MIPSHVLEIFVFDPLWSKVKYKALELNQEIGVDCGDGH